MNSCKKVLLVVVCCLCTVFSARCQYVMSKKDNALLVKNTTLAVVYLDKDEKLMKKLSKKPEELKAYEQSITDYNTVIKQVVDKEWDLSKKIEYVTETEADKIIKDENQQYCLLTLGEARNYKVADFVGMGGDLTPTAMAYHNMTAFKTRALEIVWAPKSRAIATNYFPAYDMTPGSVTYMIENLKNQVNDCISGTVTSLSSWKGAIKKGTPLIKQKTLLIPELLVSKALRKSINNNKLAGMYQHPYEVVTASRLDEVIVSKNKDYAYVWVVPAGMQSRRTVLYNYYVVDAADGRIIYATGKSVAGANGMFHPYHFVMIRKKLK